MNAQAYRTLEFNLAAAEELFSAEGVIGALAVEIRDDLLELIQKVVCARLRAEAAKA